MKQSKLPEVVSSINLPANETYNILTILHEANRFISGFEDDEMQEEPVKPLLTKIRKEKKRIESWLKDHICHVWSTQDVYEHAKQIGQKVTKAQAREILHLLDKHSDASTGINWDVVSDTITNYKSNLIK